MPKLKMNFIAALCLVVGLLCGCSATGMYLVKDSDGHEMLLA